jgi:hypothetical protein
MFDHILVAAIFFSTTLSALAGVTLATLENFQYYQGASRGLSATTDVDYSAFVAQQFAFSDQNSPNTGHDSHTQQGASAM